MSIDKSPYELGYTLTCDICGNDADDIFDEFSDAVAHKKGYGWKSVRNGREWEDVCPSCRAKEEK